MLVVQERFRTMKMIYNIIEIVTVNFKDQQKDILTIEQNKKSPIVILSDTAIKCCGII